MSNHGKCPTCGVGVTTFEEGDGPIYCPSHWPWHLRFSFWWGQIGYAVRGWVKA